jgi:hypothetical protein
MLIRAFTFPEQARRPGPRGIEDLNHIDEMNVLGTPREPISAASAPRRNQQACVAKGKKNLGEIVGRQVLLPGEVPPQHGCARVEIS